MDDVDEDGDLLWTPARAISLLRAKGPSMVEGEEDEEGEGTGENDENRRSPIEGRRSADSAFRFGDLALGCCRIKQIISCELNYQSTPRTSFKIIPQSKTNQLTS